jgi:predicted phage terminase large subunit-like protein
MTRSKNEEIARTDFSTFKGLLYPRYQNPKHLEELDKKLAAVSEYVKSGGKEGIGKLIVEMPPRHGKSLVISRLYPIWHLGQNPDHRVILASYGATLAHKNSRAARNMFGSPVYQRIFERELAPDSHSVETWDIKDHEGGMDAVGVGGGITGKGANLILIDDPLKSREEAESETIREKIWDWFTDDLYTRREPGAAIIIVQTRWHVDDLVGHLLRKQPDRWHEFRLPAIAEARDPLGRSEGEPLWNDRFPLHVLRDIEATLGPYAWSGLYQQRPTPSEGGLFKRSYFRLVEQPPDIVQAWRAWDLAMSSKSSADWTVGILLGLGADGHFYILDAARRRLDWGQVPDFIAAVILADGPSVTQGIEQQGYMSRAIRDLNADSRLHEYTISGYPVDQDKLTRALPVAAKMAAGLIHLVRAYWNDDFIEEMASFPRGSKDDQVDALSLVWAMASEQSNDVPGGINYASETRSTHSY